MLVFVVVISISSCLCPFSLHWVGKANAFSVGIRAKGFVMTLWLSIIVSTLWTE